jgi:O-antigen/teichoic acid export membrane protein
MNTAQRILKNTISQLLSGLLGQVLSLIVVVYLARVLGSGNFGKINFAVALISFFAMVANLGLSVLGPREIARHKDQIKDYIYTIVSARWWLSVIGFCVLLVVMFFINKPLETKYLILLYGLGIFPIALLPDWIFQGVERMEHLILGRLLGGVCYVGCVLWYVIGPNQILLIPCFQFIGTLITVIVLYWILLKNVDMSKSSTGQLSRIKLVKQALPIGLTGMMSMIIYYFDTVILGFTNPDQEVGNYSAAYKIILFLITLITAYHDSIFPIISIYFQKEFNSFETLQRYTTRFMIILAIPMGVGGTILAEKLIVFVYGRAYSQATISFQILIWACALIFVNTAYSRGLFASNQENICFRIVSFQAVITVIGDIFLIPPFGLVGASVATLLGEICSLILYSRVMINIVTIPFYHGVIKPLIASLIMGIFLYLSLDLTVSLLVLEGIAIFITVLYLLKGISTDEIAYMHKAIFTG